MKCDGTNSEAMAFGALGVRDFVCDYRTSAKMDAESVGKFDVCCTCGMIEILGVA